MPRIQLPHNGWHERPYQEALWDHLCGGGKRAIAVWHRRAGKDDIALHYAAIAMHTRVGQPGTASRNMLQGRKASGLPLIRTPGKRASMKRFRQSCGRRPMTTRCSSGSERQHVAGHRQRPLQHYGRFKSYGDYLFRSGLWPTLPRGLIIDRCYRKMEAGLYSLRPHAARNHAKAMYDYAVQDPSGLPSSSPSTTRAR